MNKIEIDTFIETTGEFGDVWTVEQVQDVYGDKSLDEALADRRASYEHISSATPSINNFAKTKRAFVFREYPLGFNKLVNT